MTMTLQELSDNMEIVLASLKGGDSKTLMGLPASKAELPETIVERDGSGNITVRNIRTSQQSQSVIPAGSSMTFRVNNTTDNHNRYASRGAVLDWLGTVLDSSKFEGRTLPEVRNELRYGLVPCSLTINNHRLDSSFSLTPSDMGLGNLPNFAAVSGIEGQSTSLLATQKAVYDAACAPFLAGDRKRRVTISKDPPVLAGEDGEIYIQY